MLTVNGRKVGFILTSKRASRPSQPEDSVTIQELEQRMADIQDHFLGQPSQPITEAAFKSAVQALVRQFYAEGGFLLDRTEEPILSVDDVEVIVTRGRHILSATCVRRNFDPFKA
jgi:hypothetical protein